MKRKPIAASELMAQLQANPEFTARRDLAEAEILRREHVYRLAEAPLIDDLKAVGFAVQSAWDFVNTSTDYVKAVPVLLAHLPRPYPPAVREGIARALALPEAKNAGWRVITDLYVNETDPRVQDGLATAIAAAADDEVIGDVVALARNKRFGSSRLLLLSALECSSDPQAREGLSELATDPDLAKEIALIRSRRSRRGDGG
jgi:hypothetical protein